jgi:hypothetical protein
MSAHPPVASRRLERLATPLVAAFVPASPGDIVRLACESDGAWFYCRVEDRLPDGDLVCSVVDAQWWPSLMIDGIVPGMKYAVRPDRVLSIIKPFAPTDGD